MVHSVMCDVMSGDGREGVGEFGGRDTGEGGSSRCSLISVVPIVPKPSLVLRSQFSCWRVALSSCSCVLTAWSLEFSSIILCLSSLNCLMVLSISSV